MIRPTRINHRRSGRSRTARAVTMASCLFTAVVPILTAFAQGRTPLRAPSGVTVSPAAVGPAAPTATPIGGLATRPLTSAAPNDGGHRPLVRGRRLMPLVVDDPPLTHGGVSVATDGDDASRAFSVRWTPTGDRPVWRRDPSVTPVDAWRDLIVTDVVCNGFGACVNREQRVRARWMATCGCYAFADGWNRVWRVD